MKKSIILLVLILSLHLFGNLNKTNAQCAMCKAAVESNVANDPSVKRAKGLNTGIIYMASIPYLLFGLMGYMWYRSSKKETKHKLAINTIIKKAINK